jgi:hypothetical protein
MIEEKCDLEALLVGDTVLVGGTVLVEGTVVVVVGALLHVGTGVLSSIQLIVTIVTLFVAEEATQ